MTNKKMSVEEIIINDYETVTARIVTRERFS